MGRHETFRQTLTDTLRGSTIKFDGEAGLAGVTTTPMLELVVLRVSVAEFASRLGFQTDDLPFVGKTREELVKLAALNQRGWNTLLALLSRHLESKDED